MNKKLLLLFGGVLLFSCQEKEDIASMSQLRFNINHESLSMSDNLQNVNAFLFDNNSMVRKLTNMHANSDGFYVVGTDKLNADRLLFVAGDHGVDFASESFNYDELEELVIHEVDFISTFPRLYYTGEKKLSNIGNTTLELNLTRSVARLDVKKITELEVLIDSCVVSNIADRTYLLPGNTEPLRSVEYKKQSIGTEAFSDIQTGVDGFAYLYETNGQAPVVTLYVRINGVKNKLNVTLPEKIERNKRYEIGINSNGAVLYANLQVLPWNEGESSIAKPEGFVPKIDLENSVFPTGVIASESLDSLFIPAEFEGTLTLALDAPVDIETKLESSHIQVRPLQSAKSTYFSNRFELEVKKSDINRPDIVSGMFVKSKYESQYYDKQIVIEKKGYRTRFDGLEGPITGNKVVFPTYHDGHLGVINTAGSVPILSATTQSGDSQFDWLQVVKADDRTNLEGGFKPNDVDAVGQEQTSTVTVTYVDGEVEEFMFSRKRNSIPVISQGGLYWSKFNMRGDSKSYEDQIGFDRDIPQNELYEFLKTCSDEDFAYYAGAVYKGKSTQGLYLKRNLENDSIPELLYEGYASIPDGQISNGPADTHCPAGYRIANLEEWQRIWFTGAMNLPAPGLSDYFNSSRGNNRYRIRRSFRREVEVDGVVLKNVHFLLLEDVRNYPGNQMVFNGFGAQSSNTAISFNQFIYPVITTGFTHFILDLGASRSSYGNLSGSGVHTRNIRCVKSPVNYIVE